MGRSKERGKPVEELTLDELRRERVRCETLNAIYPSASAKGLRKRLLAVEKRLRALETDQEDPTALPDH